MALYKLNYLETLWYFLSIKKVPYRLLWGLDLRSTSLSFISEKTHDRMESYLN